MHELGLCESVLDAVEKRAAGRRVTALRVKIGVLHRVSREAFEAAFTVLSAGSVAQGAAVDFVVLPVRVRCRACAVDAGADDLLAACPSCGAAQLDSAGGDEVLLDSLELDGATTTDSTGPART